MAALGWGSPALRQHQSFQVFPPHMQQAPSPRAVLASDPRQSPTRLRSTSPSPMLREATAIYSPSPGLGSYVGPYVAGGGPGPTYSIPAYSPSAGGATTPVKESRPDTQPKPQSPAIRSVAKRTKEEAEARRAASISNYTSTMPVQPSPRAGTSPVQRDPAPQPQQSKQSKSFTSFFKSRNK
uniref:Uncharacterized protein n=1 Tax=Eutreptiella gymnastica TaxID=73025 RepID=A0A7S4G0G1_9EUGL